MKDDTAIPDDVWRFILTSIPSVPYLEAVLLFRRQPAVRQSAADIAGMLYIAPDASNELLRQMQAAGVLDAEGEQYRYAADAALDDALARLAQVYARNLVGVTELIHGSTRKQAQQFADAFRLRRRT